MPRALPRFAAVIFAAVALAHYSAKPVDAQELVATTALLTLASADPTASPQAPAAPAAMSGVAFSESTVASAPDFSRIRRPLVLPALYAATAATQVLDAHSTMTALGRGAREANPVMQGVAGNSTALVAVKAGVVAGSIFVAEKMWRRNRAGAIATMVALNVVTAAIAAHNYAVASRLR